MLKEKNIEGLLSNTKYKIKFEKDNYNACIYLMKGENIDEFNIIF